MQIERLSLSDAARWREFVAAMPTGDVLQCMEWGEVKARTGWQPFTVAVVEEGRIVAGTLALRRAAPMGRSILYCPRGPVVDFGNAEALRWLVEGLRQLAREQRAILVKIDPPVGGESASVLRQAGFRPAPVPEKGFGGTQPRAVMKTFPLGDDDALLARFKPKTRYNLRLAERKGVEVTGDTTREDLRAFYDVLVETGERDGFHVRDFGYYERLWSCIIQPGLGRLFVARHAGQVLGGAIDFVLGKQCWYVYGASSNEKRNLMPNYLVQWRMMQWARDRGCGVYDFRGIPLDRPGAGSDLEGLVRFKAGFDAQYVEYVGEWDLPLSAPLYRAFTLLEPLVRRIRLKLRPA
jgi:lipid II:glycine glycyltransferase (peptidoglycan interpeptide bridge formation enzyme)